MYVFIYVHIHAVVRVHKNTCLFLTCVSVGSCVLPCGVLPRCRGRSGEGDRDLHAAADEDLQLDVPGAFIQAAVGNDRCANLRNSSNAICFFQG